MSLQAIGLVAPSPILLIPSILLFGQLLSMGFDLRWRRAPSRSSLHARIASQVIVVTATIYATGWGPALAIGLVVMGQEALAVTGSSSHRAVLGWDLSCLACGELLIAIGWAPSILPVPEVHGLAVLVGVGIAFSYRSLNSELIEKEQAAALTRSHERRFRALVQSSSDLVFVVDATSAVTYASPSCRTVLGYEPDRMIGSESGLLVHDDDIEALGSTIGHAVEHPRGTAEFRIRVRHCDGTWRWLEGIATNLLDDPAVQGLVINAHDDSQRTEHVERQAAIASLGREVLQQTSVELVFESAIRVVEGIIPSVCNILGPMSADPAVPRSETGHAPAGGTKLGLRVPVGEPELPAAVIEVTTDEALTSGDAQFLESVAGLLFSAIIRMRAEDAMRHQALHDPLTGLPNRTLFNDRLEQALTRKERVGGYVGVMVVDLDEFKNVNDSLGHLMGDALLIEVASRFVSQLREVDTIARLGGDEFAILIDDLDAPDQARHVAQRVLDALAEPLALPDQTVAIGVSVGIALADRHTSASLLFSHADAAMYRAKREGKGCFRIFEPAMYATAVERMDLDQSLRIAIADRALQVHYQPVVCARTGAVTSFEALARWAHPERGSISPATFIPLAEESGLIIELGHVVLLEACRNARIWRDEFPGVHPTVAVNVSRLQLAYPGFVDQVAEVLDRVGLPPGALTIEVTESVLASESRPVVNALASLRESGIRVAIDDFGTGYSSFAALADLPIDILKIDKRFVDHVVDGNEGRGFVSAIMHIARTLKLETIAEGVERVEQQDALIHLGCTHIQGYLFSQPMSASDTLDYLERASNGPRIGSASA